MSLIGLGITRVDWGRLRWLIEAIVGKINGLFDYQYLSYLIERPSAGSTRDTVPSVP